MTAEVKLIGQGTYGEVLSTEDPGVVKKLSKLGYIDGSLLAEISSLTLLDDCPYTPRLLSFNVLERRPFITMTRYEMDLITYILEHHPGISEIKTIVYRILLGLNWAHQRGIYHRDIKCNNMVINTSDLSVAIVDWGHSQHLGNVDRHGNIQSMYFRSPEILLVNGSYTSKIDIWGVGCILYNMLFEKNFLTFETPMDGLFAIFHHCGTPEDFKLYFPDYPCRWSEIKPPAEKDDPWIMNLIVKCLTLQPTERISVAEALAHPFFKDVRDPDLEVVPKREQKKPPMDFMDFLDSASKWMADFNVSRRAGELACYLFADYLSKSSVPETRWGEISQTCLVLAAKLVDYRGLEAYTNRELIEEIIGVVGTELRCMSCFDIPVENPSRLSLPYVTSMVYKLAPFQIKGKSPVVSTLNLPGDENYDYRAVVIKNSLAAQIYGKILSPVDCELLNIFPQREGFVHYATIIPHYQYLLFRRARPKPV